MLSSGINLRVLTPRYLRLFPNSGVRKMQNRSWYALEGLLGDHTVVVDLQFTGSGTGDRRGAATGGRSGEIGPAGEDGRFRDLF